jgi:hypothetical protein
MKPENLTSLRGGGRPSDVLRKGHLTCELDALLKEYGCRPTNEGWRRLAIKLALELNKLGASAPELRYNPHHDDTLALNGLALIADAVARPGMSKAAIARETHAAAQAIGIDQYSTAESVRAVLGKRDADARLISDRAMQKRSFPSSITPDADLGALDLAALFPSREEGQHRLNCWWEDRLSAAANAMTCCRAGTYDLETPVSLSSEVRLTSIAIVESGFDHPYGPPRKGAASSPVRAVVERVGVFTIQGDEGPFLYRRTETEVLSPLRCQLRGDAWGWTGKLDDGTTVDIRGGFGEDAASDLVGDVIITPVQNRRYHQAIRGVRVGTEVADL